MNYFDKFKRNRAAFASLILLAVIWLFSLFAEVICNDKPLMVKYQDDYYFPIFNDYSPEIFSLPYKKINYQSELVKEIFERDGVEVWYPIIPFSYNSINNSNPEPYPAKPSAHNILGTDDRGRDVFARLLYGVRLSIAFALAITFFSCVIGVTLGALQGYLGGKTDLYMQRGIEVWTSLPELYLLLLATSLFEPSVIVLFILLSLFSWVGFNDYARAEFLKIKNREYVIAARTLGLPTSIIMYRHILPNALSPILAMLPFRLGSALVALTSLDFLGLGLDDSYPSLGEMLRQAKEYLEAWWLSLSVFLVLIVILVSFVFVGEGLRDMLKDESN